MSKQEANRLGPVLIVIMGVSGSGKSSVAEKIASHYQCVFIEADDFHSSQAKAHMASGKPLDKHMRGPWVERLCEHLRSQFDWRNNCVMAFSGLAKQHRDKVRALPFDTLFVHLLGCQNIIKQRCEKRSGHFMPSSLLESQYQALETTSEELDVVEINISLTLDQIVNQVKGHLESHFLPYTSQRK